MHQMHISILGHALRGCVSDPIGIPMYRYTKTRSNGLPFFKTIRGTSQLESFHFHVARAIPTWTVSPQAMDAMIMEYAWEWNCNAAIANLGSHDYGHYNLEILDDLVPLEKRLWGRTAFPEWSVTPHVSPDDLEEMGCGLPITGDKGIIPDSTEDIDEDDGSTNEASTTTDDHHDHEFALDDSELHGGLLAEDGREQWFLGEAGRGELNEEYITQLETSHESAGGYITVCGPPSY